MRAFGPPSVVFVAAMAGNVEDVLVKRFRRGYTLELASLMDRWYKTPLTHTVSELYRWGTVYMTDEEFRAYLHWGLTPEVITHFESKADLADWACASAAKNAFGFQTTEGGLPFEGLRVNGMQMEG